MAEELPGNPQHADGDVPPEEDMEVETGPDGAEDPAVDTGGSAKRGREEGVDEEEQGDGEGDVSKKRKVDGSFEEARMEKFDEKGDGGEDLAAEEGGDDEEEVEGNNEEGGGDDEKEVSEATVGPKVFASSVEMFDYFYKLLHNWSPKLDLNRYEHMVLLDLLKKGHPEPAKKIGVGIQAFQVRYHPMWKSRCFFLVRIDETVDDFSFRKCVDNILPLPDNMKTPGGNSGKKAWNNQKGGRGGGGRGGRGGRGRGRRGGFRK